MKISKLFHWLYATLMFLPLLVAPIFGIYSHRHTIDSYSIDVPNYQKVDFNQQVHNGNFEDSSYWRPYNSEYVSLTPQTDGGAVVVVGNTSDAAYNYGVIQNVKNSIIGHIYLFKVDFNSTDFNNLKLDDFGGSQVFSNGVIIWTANVVRDSVLISPSNVVGVSIGNTYTIHSFMFFDLTQMFGSGNEPTAQQFNAWYTNDYYDYTLSRYELLQVGTETYNDTDIGSQFIYTIYGTLDKYFNFSKVFGLNQLGEYMYLNWFYGNSYIGFSCFFLLLTYWLLISLCWLIFDLLMYVPNLVHRWLDRGAIQ